MQNNQQPARQRHPFAVRRADEKPLTHSGVGEGDSSLPPYGGYFDRPLVKRPVATDAELEAGGPFPIDHADDVSAIPGPRPSDHPVFAGFSPSAKRTIDMNAAFLDNCHGSEVRGEYPTPLKFPFRLAPTLAEIEAQGIPSKEADVEPAPNLPRLMRKNKARHAIHNLGLAKQAGHLDGINEAGNDAIRGLVAVVLKVANFPGS